MAEEQIDANTGQEAAPESSSVSNYEPVIDSMGLVSTTEFKEAPKESEKAEPVKPDTPDDAGQNAPKDPEPKDKGFHEHPRFKELIDEKNGLKAQNKALEERISKIESERKPEKETKGKYKYQDVMSMKDEDLIQKFTDNPKSFLANYGQQLAHEIISEIESREQAKRQEEGYKTIQDRTLKTYQEFFKDKPDGIDLLNAGEIQRFLSENPGHNPISAYYALRQAPETISKEDHEKALKKQKEQLINELKAAGKAAPASQTPPTKRAEGEKVTPAKSRGELRKSMLGAFVRP